MTEVPAIAGIIAKVMVLVEKVLDCFVTMNAEENTYDACCQYMVFNGTTSSCGDLLVNDISQLAMVLLDALGDIVSGLLVTIY